MVKKLITAISIILFSYSVSIASGDAGVSGFEFLNIQPGALPVSLGGAYTAGYSDLYAFAYNPAGLSGIKSRSFCFDYLHYVLDIQRGLIGYAFPAGKGNSQFIYGAYLNYLNSGSFNIADEDGNLLGTFNSGSYELGVTAAKSIPASLFGYPVQFGATFKGLMEQINDDNFSAIAMDIGAQYLLKGGRVRIGASARNLGVATNELDTFPLSKVYSLGMSLNSRNWQNVKFYTDYNYPEYGDASLRLGLDIRLDRDFYFRLGYRLTTSEMEHWYSIISNTAEEFEYERTDINSLAFGLGTRFSKAYTFDVAVQLNSFQSLPLMTATLQYSWR
jgi:hypothetical protein